MTETTTQYTIKTGTFEGPLDLLLNLIESRKLFINELSLAEVTNDYVEYVRNLAAEKGDDYLHVASNFIIVAATLILIKSRSLLPNLSLTPEEEEKIVDLEARLKLYAAIKDASVYVKEKFGKEIVFSAPERDFSTPIFSPDQQITIAALRECIGSVVSQIPATEVLQEVNVARVINIDEVITNLTERIKNALSMSFRDFAKHPNPQNHKEEKVYMIVSFLALLEMVRGGVLEVVQSETFDDMTIQKARPTMEDITR